MNVVYRPSAVVGLEDLLLQIELKNRSAAKKVAEKIQHTLSLLAANPLMGAKCRTRKPAHAQFRYFTVVGYRQFVVFYRPLPDGIEFWHIFRGQRDLSDFLDNE